MNIINSLKIALPLATLMLGSAAGTFAAGEEKVEWKNLPAPVQSAIKAKAGDKTVSEVQKKTAGNATHYIATARGADGKVAFITVDAKGKLHKIREDASDVPAAVRSAIKSKAGDRTVSTVQKRTKGKKIAYVATVKGAGGKVVLITVDADGKVLKEANKTEIEMPAKKETK